MTIIRAEAGPPLGKDEARQRPSGRIGGVAGYCVPGVAARLCASLGTNSSVITTASPGFAVDTDACSLPLNLDWLGVLRSNRLADVIGGFAAAWFDELGTLHLARDCIGERTLFYAQFPHGLVFASSIRAILESGLVPRRLNVRAVSSYLCYAYLPGRETLVEGIYELLPGEHLTCSEGTIRRSNFWELPAQTREAQSEDALREELRRRLETAVRRLLPARDEPVGAFLSGGLDSSLVVALARQLHEGKVVTYSVSFGANYANELPFSSLVADHCRTEHRIVELSPAAVLHHLDDSIALLNDPIGDPLTVPNALLFREAAREVGVVLNGEGGDPCFGGPKNLPMLLSQLYEPGASRERSYLRAHLKCYDDLPELLSDFAREALAAYPLEEELRPQLADPRWPDFIARLQAMNIRLKGGHHILPKVDALSVPFGVLPRSPLFDRNVVELSLAIPPGLKLNGSVEKYLLKRAVSDLLPSAIIDRPKSGMLVPVERWFQGPLLSAARERLLDGLKSCGLFQRDYLERLLAGKLGGLRPRHGAKIWLLVTLEAWLRRALYE